MFLFLNNEYSFNEKTIIYYTRENAYRIFLVNSVN